MQCAAIPRFDTPTPGIHLAWTPPAMFSVSIGGYDIQRRQWSARKPAETCVLLTVDQLSKLRAEYELITAIGTILFGEAASFPLVTADLLFSSLLSERASTAPIEARMLSAGPHTLTARSLDALIRGRAFSASGAPIDRMVIELAETTTAVRFTAFAQSIAAFALRQGKVIDVARPSGTSPFSGLLRGGDIDSVVFYVVAATELVICSEKVDAANDDAWKGVPYLVRGLTLPIVEADPSLTTPALELNAAKSRLIAGEALSTTEFDSATPTLRQGAAHAELGRDGERILLLPAADDQTFTELSFAGQLGLLEVHPRWRRILGFGYADLTTAGLVPGETYEYRITGRFDAASLADRIYDFHAVPTGTVLPTRFFTRDLAWRLAQPPVIVLAPAPQAGSAARRGLAITDPDSTQNWQFTLTDWSLVIDFPDPVSRVAIEVAAGHSLRYWAGDPWSPGLTPTTAVPPGPLAMLTFPQPIQQLRLIGAATVFAVRVPIGATGIAIVHVTSGPVLFDPQPAPAPPIVIAAFSLQRPPTVLTGLITPDTPQPSRPEPGFLLVWLPTPITPGGSWPPDLPGGPPIDAMAWQIEHRDVFGANEFGPWTPIQSGDNIVVGTRNNTASSVTVSDGVDLDAIFAPQPPAPGTAGLLLRLQDVFTVPDAATGLARPEPALGSYHQYRIRSIDTVGRPSDSWTLSNIARLEKHVPPPLPVGPGPSPDVSTGSDGAITLRGSPGPRARVIVANDATISAEDVALLGTHANAIILQWGWRDSERDLDPTALEFRVYQWAQPPTSVPGMVLSVSSIPGGWALGFTTDRVLEPDECAGQWITSGGYPFQIIGHDAGSTPTIRVRAAAVNGAATPSAGPATFGRPLAAAHARPSSWDARVAVVPIAAASSYQHVFYDLLTLSADHPADTVWVGVSSADGQEYVPDEIAANQPNGGRPGNESSIATCAVNGRYIGRPSFVVPPPLGDIPEIVSEEPTGREVLAFFDPSALIPGALPPGTPVALDRCSVDNVLRILSVSGGHVHVALADGSSIAMDFPNPGDEAEVLATLNSPYPESLPSRYLLYVIANHPQPDSLFARISGQTDPFGPYADRLPPKPSRYFYRVRLADAFGRVSPTGAILPVVIRVPSIAPPSPPDRVTYDGTSSGVSITLRASADPTVSHLLLFHTATPVTVAVPDPAAAELLRVPNRRDLFPANGIRLRAPGGQLIEPTVKALGDPDVIVDAGGNRTATVSVTAAPTDWVTVWTCTLSRDGIPSALSGPYGRYVPHS